MTETARAASLRCVLRQEFHWGILLVLTCSFCREGQGLSVWSLHVLHMYAWVLSGFLPPPKDMHVRLIADSKLSLGVSESVHACVSRLCLCGPVMDW